MCPKRMQSIFHPIVKAIFLVVVIYLIYGGVMYYTPIGPVLEESLPYGFFFDMFLFIPSIIGIVYLKWSYANRETEWEDH
jgi:hypothetical protein